MKVRHAPLLAVRATAQAVMAALAVLAAGCVAVQPWQRGTLSEPGMRLDRDPLADIFSEHIHFTREAAAGGRGVGGGGCGCN